MKKLMRPKPGILDQLNISEEEYYECCFQALEKQGRESGGPEAFGDMPIEIRGKTYLLRDLSTLIHTYESAPEQYFTAYFFLLRRALTVARDFAWPKNKIQKQQVYDLLDAIHNIPDFMFDYGDWFVHDNLVQELRAYDDKWADDEFSLLRILQAQLDKSGPEGKTP